MQHDDFCSFKELNHGVPSDSHKAGLSPNGSGSASPLTDPFQPADESSAPNQLSNALPFRSSPLKNAKYVIT
jgi:hypothetical protein